MMAFGLFSQGFSIMLAQFRRFFRGEIGFFRCMKVFFHLFYDMLCLKVMLYFKVGRRSDHLMGVPADRAELPFLETIHVREGPAGGAPDDEVHDKEVMRVILIKIYRLIVRSMTRGSLFFCNFFSKGNARTGTLMKGRYSSHHTDPMLSHDDEIPVWGDYRSFGDPQQRG
jgi:hypothetical protein